MSGDKKQETEEVTGGFAAARMFECAWFSLLPRREASHEFLIPDPLR
jgi:hypothetical protein